ncbi:hypothetical protein ELUMI_v1c05230 [Williamsoniiplasma luminosum]|uniref:Uncharacterized protein n=1 Tax=Williamsoniiplasma luminosum TaxID=214888 RepID=A0A2K8NU06_9MOLU|nr:hypothetical protein ELUMI_v1c05230 [Williamsoniiplasma luminosum]
MQFPLSRKDYYILETLINKYSFKLINLVCGTQQDLDQNVNTFSHNEFYILKNLHKKYSSSDLQYVASYIKSRKEK